MTVASVFCTLIAKLVQPLLLRKSMSKNRDFIAIGHVALGEPEAIIINTTSFEIAAKEAAKQMLENMHPDWNDNIYIDFVIDRQFTYKDNFIFSVDDLR